MNGEQEQTQSRPRGSYYAVVKSKDADSNYTQILEAPTRKELAKVVANTIASPGGNELELVFAARGKKLIAQEQKTVQFT